MTAQTRRAALDAGLLRMAADGQRPICSTYPSKWMSDDRDERESAAAECATCPVLNACRDAGTDEEFGVWGGEDRTPSRGRPKQATPKETT